MDEALRKLTEDERDAVRELYLYSNMMASVPQSITMLRNLEELWLDRNNISELPSFLTQLTALKFLSCLSNRLVSVPRQASRLVNLEQLYLRNNQLSSVPAPLVNLTKLQT